MKITCGTLIRDTNTGKLLGCKATGNNNGLYDIPKGCIEDGETLEQAALRELFEETHIDLRKKENAIHFYGQFPYMEGKELALFWTELPLDISSLRCTSLITKGERKGLPEMDGYALIDSISLYYRGLRKYIARCTYEHFIR